MSVRRAFLQQLALLAGSVLLPACGASPAPPPSTPPLPSPLELPPFPELVTAASLSWLLLARPKAFTAVPTVAAGIQRLVPDGRRALFERVSGIQLDRIDHLVVAAYPDSTIFLVDGVRDPLLAERLYRDRLMSGVTRSVHRHDLVLVRGKTAHGAKRSLAAMGSETVAIESGGWLHTKVAALYAQGKLRRTPRALEIPDVRMLLDRLGDAPLAGIAPGPFEGEWQQALHGLLGVCTVAAGTVRVEDGAKLRVDLALAGDWIGQEDKALERVLQSWDDVAQSSFGRLTGLDRPVDAPRTHHDQRVIGMSVAVDGARFVDGLYAAVRAEARDLMRL